MNAAFYEAFRQGDLRAMDRLWAKQAVVACIHPGWDALHGREAVMASWDAILTGPDRPDIRCVEETVVVLGEVAYVTCIERVGDAELVATNLFVREAGRWRLVHHQAGPFSRTSRRPAGPDTSLN